MVLTCYTLAILVLALARTTIAHSYSISDTYIGHDFFDSWTWQTLDDPTHGRVNYVDKWNAKNSNLSYATSNKFVMRVDSYQIVPPTARGRDSVRVISNKAYSDSLVILDVSHMPQGCGTWPAFWSLSQAGPWPQGGEIDIIEGVHQNTNNLASLHTKPGCNMTDPRHQSGKTISTNCDTSVNSNQGCGTSFNKPNSYGDPFNADGGGFYIMERSKTKGISVWFWSRHDPYLPLQLDQALDLIPIDCFGVPDALFPVDTCDYDTHFDDHQLIFDITLCGDWAGATFSSAGCGTGSCNDFVNNNPEKFKDAYWEINSLRIFTPFLHDIL